MAFVLRRPFAVTAALKQSSRPTTTLLRSFHNQTPRFRPSTKLSPQSETLFGGKNAFQSAFKRSYQQQSEAIGLNQGTLGQRLLFGAGIFGGTLVLMNFMFNRETREDGGMPLYERSYLNETMMHTGLGLGVIALAARTLHVNGWSYRLMATNPWLVFGVGLAGSIGTMMATFYTSPDNYIPKYGLWTAFNVTQGALLAPLMFVQPALLARAGLYTVGVMGSIAFVGATAKQDKYLYLGGPLLAGVAVVALSGLAPLVLPATAVRTLMWSERMWLYGGLAVFGGFTLWDVQKILAHARMAEAGMMKRDPVNESISLELDFINIFIRLVQILGMQQRRK